MDRPSSTQATSTGVRRPDYKTTHHLDAIQGYVPKEGTQQHEFKSSLCVCVSGGGGGGTASSSFHQEGFTRAAKTVVLC